jgi:hypothetical protein
MMASFAYFAEHHPRLTAIMLGLAIGTGLVLAITDIRSGRFDRAQEEIIARDKAALECRMSGRSWEYFGTQGYACVPAKVMK